MSENGRGLLWISTVGEYVLLKQVIGGPVVVVEEQNEVRRRQQHGQVLRGAPTRVINPHPGQRQALFVALQHMRGLVSDGSVVDHHHLKGAILERLGAEAL